MDERAAEVRRWRAWCARVLRPYPVHSVVDTTEKVVDAPPVESPEDLAAKRRVEKWQDDLLRSSPMVRFMVKHLTLLDCDPVTPRASSDAGTLSVPPKLLIASCPPDIAGGFSPRARRDEVTLTHTDASGAGRFTAPLGTPIGPGDTVFVGERWF